MADPQTRLDEMLVRLKARKFRITPQRLAILKILAASDDHPSVERIYEQVKENFATTSLATIYKTVMLLKQLHEVLELGFPDGSNRYDGNRPYPHPHVVCLKCKRIMDPDLGSTAKLAAEAALQTGYKIVDHRLDFFGICPECQEKEQNKK
ncbi:MAG: Fur family transcriptional regulator [Desulfobaccales bacterium]